MNNFPIGEIFAILFGILSIFFNKQFSKLFLNTQKILFNKEYGIWEFRIPVYLIGGLFLSLGIYGISLRLI